jgi:hypothetical protein
MYAAVVWRTGPLRPGQASQGRKREKNEINHRRVPYLARYHVETRVA